MGREVILNNTQLDVMADDDLEISYENSLLQSISDFKMSYTNTYTLPLTAKNRAIFKAINDVNADTGIARKYHTLYEYRDGIPVIEDARVDIKNVKPRDGQIDIEVIWGALKSISDELGKENINDLPGETIFWGTSSTFLPATSTLKIGFLYYFSLQGVSITDEKLNNIKAHLPSVRVDYILDLILNRLTTPVSVSDKLKTELARYWIPCTNMKISDITSPTLTNVFKVNTIGNCGLKLSQWLTYNYSILQEVTTNGNFGGFRNNACNSSYRTFYLNAKTNVILTCNVVMSIPSGKVGDVVILTIRAFEDGKNDAWEINTNKILLTGENFNDTTLKTTFRTKSFSFNVEDDTQPMFLDTWWLESGGSSVALIDGTNATIQNEYLFQLADEVDDVPFENYFDAIYNLPKISQLDFIKDIMAITGSYTYFQDGTILFDYMDSVLSANALNIENWLSTREPETIETEYDGFAQENTYKYLEDDTITFDPSGSILISDKTLEAEKEVTTLKFGASNVVNNMARIELFNVDTGKYIGSSLKPRILESFTRGVVIGDLEYEKLAGTFSSNMWWNNILPDKYKLVKSILTEPRVIEVEMYLQMADIYKLKTNDLYYFWGSNWIMIDITISTNGGATGKFIQLN